MSCKKRIEFKKSKICIKDRNIKITVQYRTKTERNKASSISTMGFTDVGEFWAAIKTNPAKEPFNDVNLGAGITTDFYIKFTDTIDIAKNICIKFDSRRFEVINPENLNEDNLILKFRTVDKGSILKEATEI